MDTTIERNVMLRNVSETDITSKRNITGTDITIERNVQGTDITSKRNVQGRTLQVRGMYSVRGIGDRHYK